MELDVEWDDDKAADVAAERGLSFEDAATVFLDPLAITVHDQDHSTDEVRYATIGTTRAARLLVVIHTDRGRSVRIITAWPATPAERRSYEQGPRR